MVIQMTIRTYSELITLPTFEERFQYLKLDGIVGKETFGYDRYLNQILYHSSEWRSVKDYVITRDGGNDLGVPGYEIYDRIYVHHMNPLLVKDILSRSKFVLDPEYLICTRFSTHQAIHYGDDNIPRNAIIERKMHDTCPWKH